MKKCRAILLSFFSPVLFFSCASTKGVQNIKSENALELQESNLENSQNESSGNEIDCALELNEELSEQDSEPEPIFEPVPTEEEVFASYLENIEISVVSAPKIVTKNRSFAVPYVFQVLDNEKNPVADFPVTVSYPSEKNVEGKTEFATQEFKTDKDGKITFLPAKPSFSCSDKVSAYPTAINESEIAETASASKKVFADWKVRSDIISKGAVLFVWDYNERNRPTSNSYEILSEFRNRGMSMVGNAPVNDAEYIGKSLDFLYKENYEIIEDSYGYLVCGTIKFVKPVAPCDEGYLCSLVAEIQIVDMKNGKKAFSSSFEHEATGKNWNACVSKCKNELAEIIVNEIMFGL